MKEGIRISAKMPEAKRENKAPQILKTGISRIKSPIDHILFLQRTIGNQAVQRLIKSGVLQAKLRIGKPDDFYEQEADRIAEQVMRMPAPTLQRACAPCAAGGAPCPKCENEKIGLVQRKTEPLVDSVDASVSDNFLHNLGPGKPLTAFTRAFFEPRFGYDFSGVRVHTDSKAAEAARVVNAHAFTIGQDIVFSTDRYVPETAEGRSLIAHELTHVVQQASAVWGDGVARGGQKASISQPSDPAEREADRIAETVIAGGTVGEVSRAPPLIHRATADDCYTDKDIIDNRIDPSAQTAIFVLVNSPDAGRRSSGVRILHAIKMETLGGIYQADRAIPALRARSVGSNWWNIVPNGQDATCYNQPPDQPTIMVFRPGAASDDERLSQAMARAFDTCGVDVGEKCFINLGWTKPKPPPPPPPPPPQSCQCDPTDPGTSSTCPPVGDPPIRICLPVPEAGERCGKCAEPEHRKYQCECYPETEDVAHMCPSRRCDPIAGKYDSDRNQCGKCWKKGGEEDKCYDIVWVEYEKEKTQCNDDYQKESIKCVAEKAIKCGGLDMKSCAEFVKCGFEAKKKFDDCDKKAWDKYWHKKRKCYHEE